MKKILYIFLLSIIFLSANSVSAKVVPLKKAPVKVAQKVVAKAPVKVVKKAPVKVAKKAPVKKVVVTKKKTAVVTAKKNSFSTAAAASAMSTTGKHPSLAYQQALQKAYNLCVTAKTVAQKAQCDEEEKAAAAMLDQENVEVPNLKVEDTVTLSSASTTP